MTTVEPGARTQKAGGQPIRRRDLVIVLVAVVVVVVSFYVLPSFTL